MDESRSGPDPTRIVTLDDLARELDLLRSRAAHGTRSARVSLEQLAARAGEPRSTIHAYLTGKRLAPAQVLDRIVIALGTTPDEQREWAEAWYRVCADRTSTHRAGASPGPGGRAATGVVPRQLPPPVDTFTGRVGQLMELDELLLRTEPGAIAAICGPAGVGKSALAFTWAQRRESRFPDGHMYVDLHGFDARPPLEPAAALVRFVRALGGTVPDGPVDADELAGQYRTLLSGRRMLIVLDNAADTDQVRHLLPGAGSCAVLVTSRDGLPGLIARHGGHRFELDVLPGPEAVALLQQVGVDAPAGQLQQLAEQCGGLPLALRIAADLLDGEFGVSPADLCVELADDEQLMELLAAGDDPHTALRAVLRWSYERLPGPAARAYRLLALHPGRDLGVAALAALTDTGSVEAHRIMGLLVRLHLVRQSRPGHLTLNRIQRAHAAELSRQLDSYPDRMTARSRLAEHYLHTAARAQDLVAGRRAELESAGTGLVGLDDRAAAESWLASEAANVAAIAKQVITTGEPAALLRRARTVTAALVLPVLRRLPEVTGNLAPAGTTAAAGNTRLPAAN